MQNSFLDWIGLDAKPDWTKARFLGSLIGFVVLVFAGLVLLGAAVSLGLFLATLLGLGPYSADQTGAAVRNVGLVVAAVVGLPFLVWRSVVAQKNSETAEQAQITDRINKAVQGLGAEKAVKRILETPRYKKKDGEWERDKDGNPVPALRPDDQPIIDRNQYEETLPNIEVRVGAVLSLERISRDSDRDYKQVMNLLATYIRENSNLAHQAREVDPEIKKPKKLRADLQAAFEVLAESQGRTAATKSPTVPRRLQADLSLAKLDGVRAARSNLSGANLENASLVQADLAFSRLDGVTASEGCDFTGTNLEGCNFERSQLRNVRLSRETVLRQATFTDATLIGIRFFSQSASFVDFDAVRFYSCSFSGELIANSSFRSARLDGCRFDRTGFFGVDFTGAAGWRQELFDDGIGVALGEGKTILPEGAKYPSHWLDLSGLSEGDSEFAIFELEWAKWSGRHWPF